MNLKEIREEKNISLLFLSHVTGIRRDKLTRMERGLNSISIEDAIALTKALGVQIKSNAQRVVKRRVNAFY